MATAEISPQETREHLLNAARDLHPLLREHAKETEDGRRLAEPVEKALREAGMFKLTVPRKWGGWEVDTKTYIDVCAELAKGDSSAAWVSMILAGGGFLGGITTPENQKEMYGGDQTAAAAGILTPSATSKKVDGGQEISGRWMWASGSYQVEWIGLAFPVVDDAGNVVDQGVAMVPMSELEIVDMWYVAGMAGTASNTVTGENIFVPEHRIISMGKALTGAIATEHPDEPLYRTPVWSFICIAIVGPVLGMAEYAYDLVLESLKKRGKPVSYSFYESSVEMPSVQLAIADARSLIDSAILHAHRAADDIDRAGEASATLDEPSRARIRSDVATAALRCREAVDLLLTVGGAGSFASANPLQRVWRDLETATRHGTINTNLARETYGRALLGLDPVTPLI